MSCFTKIPEKFDFIKHLKGFGTWATIIKDIPRSISELGFDKLDIVYVYNEQGMESGIKSLENFESKSKLKLSDPSDLKMLKNQWLRICDHRNQWDNTIFDVANGAGQTVRLYDHELNLGEKPKEMYEAYDIIHFTAGNLSKKVPPALDQTISDLVGALMIDGLSEDESIQFIASNNLLDSEDQSRLLEKKKIENENKIPNYYFKLKEGYRNLF